MILKSILVIGFFLLNTISIGQIKNHSHQKELLGVVVLDTIKISKEGCGINVLWLGDTIALTKYKTIVEVSDADYEKYKIYGKRKRAKYREMVLSYNQNCYSYALEKYFERDSCYRQNLFNKDVTIRGDAITKILNNSFEIIEEFAVGKKRNLSKKPLNKTLIGLVNANQQVAHLMYYEDEVFYTKNGMFPARTFSNLKKFLRKHYRGIKSIRVYRFEHMRK